MMTNLFSIFDPATSSLFSMNWFAMLFFISLYPMKKWLFPNRLNFAMMTMTQYIYKELMPIVKKTTFFLIVSLTFFLFILFNNIMGMFPYVFTSSAHGVFTLSLSLTSWISLMMWGWLNNYSNLLVHLIPQGTPYLLMPFMVMIESISNLIRPLTLAIRLSANMIAGHLLLVLLSTTLMKSNIIAYQFLFTAQIILTLLEIAVSLIQAYVFSVLITLYFSEFAN